MKRVEKRRQRKLVETAANNAPPAQPVNASTGQQTLTIEQAIDFAVQHHGAGRLPKAEGIYQQILQTDPDHPVALHLLGVIAHQVGKNDIAVDLITKALAVKPDYAEAHNNLGLVLHHLGRLGEAVASYHKALAIQTNYVEAHCNLGNVLQGLAKLDEAVASYQAAIATNPDYAEAHYNLGNTFQKLTQLEKAVAGYRKALTIQPDHVEALCSLGIVLKDLGRLDDAVASYRKALAIDPHNAQAHSTLGALLQDLAKLDEAVESYHKALAINPDHAPAHSNLGNVFKDLGRLDEAVASYRKALAINPGYAIAHYNLGNGLRELGRLDEAVASYNEAIVIDPDSAPAHSNLGNVFQDLGRWDEAVASFYKALAINPAYAIAHYNLGNAFKEQGRLDEAVASYHKALVINPDYAAVWNNLKFVAKVLQFSKAGGDREGDAGASGLNDSARAAVGYALHQFYLAGFRPHEADESYEKIVAALPPMAGQTIPINGGGRRETEEFQLPNKLVALLHFGRSGTGLLHSLIDGHPEISTLPGVYLRGYFNEGVWEKLAAGGWRGLPQRFADTFAVLFDARTSKPVPSKLGETSFFIGKTEGMTAVGENRDEWLSLDREAFCAAALRLMEGLESVDPMSFLTVVHAAFDAVVGPRESGTGEPNTNKHLCFYHIHNPDDYAMPNFLRYATGARLLMMVREPIQNCESSIRQFFTNNDHDACVHTILGVLFGIDQIAFRMRPSVGVRLEDLKARPEATMQSLCAWLGVENSPSLYQMTAQGKKWWGDPSSPDYAKDKAMSPFDDATTNRPLGAILSEQDQFILQTLFYPFSVRFGYRKPDPFQFQKDLKAILPLLGDLLDFERVLSKRAGIGQAQFKRKVSYLLLRAALMDRWQVLNAFKDYPNMIAPLDIAAP